MGDAPAMQDFPSEIRVDSQIDAGYMAHYVPIPAQVAVAVGGPGARVIGTVDGHPFRRMLHNGPDGVVLRFGKRWLADLGLQTGADVWIEIERDPEPDRVDLPAELQAALDADADAAWVWESLTPGKKRTLAYHVTRAKRPATRAKRASETVRALLVDR